MSARVTAQPTMASGAVKIGKSFTGSRQAVGVSGFAGKPLKARAVSMGRRVAAHQPLRVVAEKVVGIDLGTTNSAVRTPSRLPPRPRFRRPRLAVPGVARDVGDDSSFRIATSNSREVRYSFFCLDALAPR